MLTVYDSRPPPQKKMSSKLKKMAATQLSIFLGFGRETFFRCPVSDPDSKKNGKLHFSFNPVFCLRLGHSELLLMTGLPVEKNMPASFSDF